MKDSLHLPAPAARWRMAFALMAILALAVGAAAPHDVALEPSGALASLEIAATAVHPGAPAHIEDAEFEVHPPCPACLLQFHTGTALGRPPASPSLVVSSDRLAAWAERSPSREVPRSGPARAPPALSRSV